jgi:hypothetical protein
MYQGQKTATTAMYAVEKYANGQVYIKTSVRWGAKRGRFLEYQSRSGTIETRSRFKAWAKKYNVFDQEAVKIWESMKIVKTV